MPRQARKQSETDYYHVMIRGINREYIFKGNRHKEKYIEIMKKAESEGLIKIGAWCIMDNHVHMLIKATLKDMSKAIKIICLKYGAYYNKTMNRIGPVFGDRYKSQNIEDDKYMLQVIRYIHYNPIKGKIVNDIKEYKWNSYKYYIEKSENILVEQKEFILGFFDNSIDRFIEYHKEEDKNEYLEIKEDKEKYRLEIGQKVLDDYYKRKGIINIDELNKNPNWLDEIVKELIEKTNLTLRQIAKLTGLSVSTVYKKK